ncbi:MAG: heme biosynthesis HemY N-terminal domain-containing protein [Halieaceae bacterium]
MVPEMRRLFLLVLLTLLAAVGLVALIETDPGYVLISYGLTTLETSVWVGLLLLMVFYLVLHLVFKLARRLLATRELVADWVSRRAYSRQLAKSQMQLDAGDFAAVIETVSAAGARPAAQELRLLARAHMGQGDWAEVIKLMPRLRKQAVFGVPELAAMEQRAYTGLLLGADANELKTNWAGFPAEQRKNASLVECYGRLLLEGGDDLEAEKVLTKAIKQQWDGRLVAQYGRIRGRDPARRLKLAESWLSKHPEDASLMLCLGRLSLRNNLWGQARDYFEASHRLEPSAETCAELARLLFSLGERERSAQYYREGLLLRESNLPELPLPEREQARSVRAR